MCLLKCVIHRLTKSVTVVDTISTTVIFYFLPPEGGFLRKTGLFPNISVHRRNVCPGLMRPWSEKIGLDKMAIVIRVETINYYFLYTQNRPWLGATSDMDGFLLIPMGGVAMSRISRKENKNIYQTTREELVLSREAASELMETISPERLVRIEGDRICRTRKKCWRWQKAIKSRLCVTISAHSSVPLLGSMFRR